MLQDVYGALPHWSSKIYIPRLKEFEVCIAVIGFVSKNPLYFSFLFRFFYETLENKPGVVVDRGFCTEALRRLGLSYRHDTFGECS